MSSDDPLLWYFAYGSNLDPRTFLGRRKMRPLEVRVARLDQHRLVFDLPIGKGERGVANVLPEPGASLTGVAYQITSAQAQRLDRSEGVPRAYRRIDVELAVVNAKAAKASRLSAFTYLCPRRTKGRKPSPRYMGLLLHGARHHNLPEAYIQELRGIELAVDERVDQLELFPRPS